MRNCYFCDGPVEEREYVQPSMGALHQSENGDWVWKAIEPITTNIIECIPCGVRMEASHWHKIHNYQQKRYNDLLERIEKSEKNEHKR